MRGDVAAVLDTHPTPGDGLGGVINADLGKLGGCPRIGFSSNAPPNANPSGCRDNNTPVNTEVLWGCGGLWWELRAGAPSGEDEQ